jgi:FkbM family methyltransferase
MRHYMLTAHGRYVGCDESGRLVQLQYADDIQNRLVELNEAFSDDGPLKGFSMLKSDGVALSRHDIAKASQVGDGTVSFSKDGLFLCAEPSRPELVHNRVQALAWERFLIVPEDRLVSAALAAEIKEQLTHDQDSGYVRLLASMTITRAALNNYYNSLDANGRAWCHYRYAKVFRNGGILSPGEWIINFNGNRVKFPLRRESAWLDWDTAISAIGHDVEVKITYENLVASDQPPALFLDVGANYGTHSLLFLSAGIPTISFEPNEACFAYFVELCKLNGIDGHWEQVAIGDTTGEIQLIYPEKDTWVGRVQSPHADPTTTPAGWRCRKVPLRKLDDYLESLPSGDILIKIDVEGFEPQVICGATSLLHFRKPKLIFESFGPSRTQLFELLTGRGYSIHLLPWSSVTSSNSLGIHEFSESKMTNFIAIPPLA